MAFGGRELRLILSIQSYGTTNIARLRQDIARLSTAAEVANARQLAQAKLAQRAARVSAAEVELRNVKAGLPAYAARNKLMNAWGRANASVISSQARQMDLSRRLFDIDTKRQALTRRIGLAKTTGGIVPVDLKIMERGLESLNMQEAALNQSVKALNANLAVQKSQLHDADLAYKKLIRTKGIASAEAKAAATALQLETAAYNQQAAAVARLDAAVRAKPFEELERTGRKLAHIGRTAQFAGLITTAAFGLASSSFANFSERVSLAATQMRDIGAPIAQTAARSKELQDRILELGMGFPASATEMSEAAYEIFSSMNIVRNGVVDTAKGFELLTTANKAAVAGGVELEEATDAIIVVLNNFDPALNRTNELLNQMFSVVRFGNLRLNDLGQAMNYLAPIAKTVGLEFSDVGAAFATLTILTKNTETASTGLARAIELFRLPVVQEGFKKWGVSITDAQRRLLPLNVVIERLIKRFPGLATGQQSAIEALIQITKASEQTKVGIQGTVQARRAIASLATSMDLYKNILGNVTNNQKEFNQAFQARMLDPGVQWQIFLRQMQTLVLVIGRDALPVFLALGKKLESFVRWFKELDSTVRSTIVRLAALVGIGLLLGGTFLNIIGSVIALRANMVLMSIAAEGTAKRFAVLRIVIGSFALLGLGLIIAEVYDLQTAVIVMTTAWVVWKIKAVQSIYAVVASIVTGSAVAASAIRAALLRTGIGALIVLIGLAAEKVISDWNRTGAFFQAFMAALMVAWDETWNFIANSGKAAAGEVASAFGAIGNKLGFLPGFDKSWIGKSLDDLEQWGNDYERNAETAMTRIQRMVGETFTREYNRAMDAAKKSRKGKDKSVIDDIQRTFQQIVSEEVFRDMEKFVDALNPDASGLSDAASLTKKRVQEIAQAYENMQQKIGSAVDNLAQIYDRLEQENEQALGSLFQGPTMQGIFGDVFRQINDQLRQFGIQIPVPFDLLQRDMDQQLTYFRRWRSDLDKLMSRGAPLEMINQIRALGPEAIPLIEGLLGANPKQFKKYVKDFKTGQKLIKQAAKADMDAQLKDWERHGKNIAWQIISGLASDPAQAKLKAGFRQYVVGTFGDILRTQMSKEVQAAMVQAAKEATAAKTGTKDSKGIKPPTAGQETTIRKQVAIAKMTANQTRKAIQAAQKTIDRLSDISHERITKEQQRTLTAAMKRRARLRKHLRAIQEKREREHRDEISDAADRRGLRTPGRGSGGSGSGTNVTYEGDTVTIKADGATPAAVTRALNKQQFRKRTKHGRTGNRR